MLAASRRYDHWEMLHAGRFPKASIDQVFAGFLGIRRCDIAACSHCRESDNMVAEEILKIL
jgi:hypothetical protein